MCSDQGWEEGKYTCFCWGTCWKWVLTLCSAAKLQISHMTLLIAVGFSQMKTFTWIASSNLSKFLQGVFRHQQRWISRRPMCDWSVMTKKHPSNSKHNHENNFPRKCTTMQFMFLCNGQAKECQHIGLSSGWNFTFDVNGKDDSWTCWNKNFRF